MATFTPASYNSLTAMREASILEAHSDTTFEGLDVFGYYEGCAYEAQYVYDDISEATYAVAGDCIDEIPRNVVHVPQTYKYTDLSEDIKAKVLKNHEAKACEYDDWYSDIYDATMHAMSEKGIEIDNVPNAPSCGIRFTGFHSQGDGASFTGWVNLKEFLEAHQDILMQVPELYHMLGTAGQESLVDIECALIRVSNRHYHEKTVDFGWDVRWVDGDADAGEYMKCIEDDIQDRCRQYMRDLYKKLEAEYDYLLSEQCLIDNDLQYTEDGEEVW